MWETVLGFLTEYTEEAGAAGGLVAILLLIWGILKWPFSRKPKTDLSDDTIDKLKTPTAEDRQKMTVADFLRVRREIREDLLLELAIAPDAEKEQLRARIAELEDQIANPDDAFAEAQKRIAELEALLERSGNQIGGDWLAEARTALERGDYSIADELFAEIEERRKLEVQEAARAAFGRGEIAEAEVRWADAARHYGRAVDLEEEPAFETLFKAREFAWRAGDFDAALGLGNRLLKLARTLDAPEKLARALNEHALTVRAQGRFAEAEALYVQALEIDKATIGERHPNYAIRLNNLAGVVEAQGRFGEAEALYVQALEIGKATIGERHPNYAIRLNNLAGVVEAQGRFGEAEALYVQALEIGKATIGERHPNYAIRLNNLAGVVEAQGRFGEAEALYVQALEIFEQALGAEHPSTQTVRANLEQLLSAKPD